MLITRESRLADLFRPSGEDSLQLVEFSLAIEEEFELRVPESATDDTIQLLDTGTVGELAEFLDR